MVTFTVSGRVDMREAVSVADAFHRRRTVDKAIWDFTSADTSELTIRDMLAAYGPERGFRPSARRRYTAILVRDDLQLNLARVFQAVAEMKGSPVQFGFFITARQARGWLESMTAERQIRAMRRAR
ncbi:MAG: hypothetical protein ACMVY4_13425 [Minwuia sp.]|uniref:hypothetical protein n=1 Tax=Minwuia sp. TaxID=2493630 RepID=UPI003A8A9C31